MKNVIDRLRKTWLWRTLYRIRHSLAFCTITFFVWYIHCVPQQLFDSPVSTIVVDKEDRLLGAKIANDDQWRFPTPDSIPIAFAHCLINFEDQRFYSHWGIDPIGFSRAMKQNIEAGRVVSGGSTLSMQLIRLHRQRKSRGIGEKLIETIMATRLEMKFSKDEILKMYCANAPFGGNVVGLSAASWKYFGRPAHRLSWAENATLAVLPNSPSLIHPGKNRDALKFKRNLLLKRLMEKEIIDTITYELSILEPLPEKPIPLPTWSPHLVERSHKERPPGSDAIVKTTIDLEIQARINHIIKRHSRQLQENGILNAAALVVDVESSDVLAYTANAPCRDDNHCYVDIITSPRSTGSIIKPLLYAAMLSEGKLLPKTLVADIPTYYKGYAPKNFDYQFSGAVHSDKALSRSLNIPAVRHLKDYGYHKFHHLLQKLGLSTLTHSADHYGLSMILGGAETTMWDLGGVYSAMSRTLGNFADRSGRYDPNDFRPLNFYSRQSISKPDTLIRTSPLSASSIWFTFKAMLEVSRPNLDRYWENFRSSHKIAWKTGTSFGFRDAWAVGISRKYVAVVWAGNADGEGRPNLIGSKAAGPVLFQIFDALQDNSQWFQPPHDELSNTLICKNSGHLASQHCPDTLTTLIPTIGKRTLPCTYCQTVHVNPAGKRVSSDCMDPALMKTESYFTLPATQEWYYKGKNAGYRTLPDYADGCVPPDQSSQPISVVYPEKNAVIYIPIELGGKQGNTVFMASHRNNDATLYWHLDEEYIGLTKRIHEMGIAPTTGQHTLTVVDETGMSVSRKFTIASE